MNKYKIIDTSREEDKVVCTVEDENGENLRSECCELLNDFYEISHQYGDPIHALLRYISVNDMIILMKEYNYTIIKENIDKKYIVELVCRYSEGASAEDIKNGDGYEYGYSVRDTESGEYIYDFCNEEIANKYR